MANKSASTRVTLKISSYILRLLLNIVFYVMIVVLVIICSKEAFGFAYQLYGPATVDKAPGREIIVQINKGDSTMAVAGKLELNRAIVNKYSFYLKAKLQNKTLMPGTYRINSSMTYNDILSIITDYSESIVQQPGEGNKQETNKDTNTD